MSNRKTKTNSFRKLFPETLESRQLMASDLSHNFLMPHDVNDDRHVTPSDALMVINKLNRRGADDTPHIEKHFEDVNDDSRVSPSDALMVINQLNASRNTPAIAVEREAWVGSPTGSAAARFELESEGSELELSIRLIGGAASTTYNVSLNDFALGQLTTDNRGRGRLDLSEGDDNRKHQPLPGNLPPITSETELIIGDIVRGKLSTISGGDDKGGLSGSDKSNGNSKDNSTGNTSNSSSTSSSSTSSSESEWVATFAKVGKLQREAEFETETERGVTKSKFKAQVTGGAANTTYDVTVGGIAVGQVKTDSRGKGKLTLSSNPKKGELQLPANFPVVNANTVVTIGDASAKFVRV